MRESILHKTALFLKVSISLFIFLVFVLQYRHVCANSDRELIFSDCHTDTKVIQGLIDIDKGQKSMIEKQEIRKILTNHLGLERINDERRKKGLNKLVNYNACQFGDEIVKEDKKFLKNKKDDILLYPPYEDNVFEFLPSEVDNSQLKSFPPIGDQGALNSCVSYSTTYYQMTHMFGMELGWDVKSDVENKRKFSPKWTFNLTNAGENGVFGLDSTYLLFSKCGAALWNDFPYYPDDISKENYTKWPTDASVWRNALNYRIKDYGYIKMWDGSKTPIEGPDDPELYKVKQLINNGYVLTFETNISIWRFSNISDDKSIREDDVFVNEYIAHLTDKDKLKVDGHTMTIVGYNDNIWVDINGNGSVDQGEKGAFKIANSWGTYEEMISSDDSFTWYSNEGFIWLSYDALNSVSNVSDCPKTERRNVINGENKVYWILPKKASQPKMMIEYTINHENKYEIETLIGYSSYDKKSPDVYMDPYNINLLTSSPLIESSFNGTNKACDATFVFDISQLYDKYDNIKGRIYLSLCDKEHGKPCTVKDIKVIDNVKKQTYYYNGKLPISFDNSSIDIGPFDFKKEILHLNGFKIGLESMPTKRNFLAAATVDSKIFAIGGVDDKGNYLKAVEAYDPYNNRWEKKCDLSGEQYDKPHAVSVNNRLFVIRKSSYNEGVVEEYDCVEDKWTFKSNINYWEHMDVLETKGKVYTIGADDIYLNEDVVYKIDEFDATTNTVSEATYMEKGLIPISTGALDGKIYIFGCAKYNFETDIQSHHSAYDFDWRLRIYDTETNLWQIGDKISFKADKGVIESNGKFYGVYADYQNKVRICMYNPLDNSTTNLDGSFMNRENLAVASSNDCIMLIGGKSTGSATSLNKNTDVVEIITIDNKKIPPVLEPPKNLILEAKKQRTFADIGEADYFGNTDIKVTNNAPDSFPVGTTYVLWTAEDMNGNITKAVQQITMIIDMTAPELVVPEDIYAGTNMDEKYVDIGSAIVRNKIEYTVINNAPEIFKHGKTIVKWMAIDNFGNITSKSQMVHVYKYGDIDGNGLVNTLDFAHLRMFLLGKEKQFPGEYGDYAADVDGNSIINSVDFALTRQYFLGYIDRFPAEK